MTTTATRPGPWLTLLRAPLMALLFAALAAVLAACGGSDADLPPPTGPSLAQPTDQSTTVGSSAIFDVGVVGGTGATFQWQQSTGGAWSDIAGATDATLVIAGATLAQSGTQYRVTVTTVSGDTLVSNPATLTVTPVPVAPGIVSQPADQSVTEPATATFTITASGTGPLTYQWQRLNGGTWTPIAGATAASYTTPATARASDNGAQFRVVIGNAVGSVTSNAATLTVDVASPAPAFVTQPADATVSAPATASFTVAVTGTPTPTLQWQLSTDGGTSWNAVSTGSGATGTTYTTPATTTAMSGYRYRAIASNGVGPAVASNPARLTVNAGAVAPSIATQPANQTVTEPAAATFTVGAAGTGPLAHQWQRLAGATWNNINGATGASYTTPATVRAADNGAQFRVVVTSTVGSVTSNPATLTVLLSGTAKAWGPAQLLRAGGDNTRTAAEVAMDGSGNALVVWGQELSATVSRSDIWSNRYAVGSGWSTAQVIETNDLSDTGNSQPYIAVDAAGNALAVWDQSPGSGPRNIWANRYTAGTGWGTPELIETGNAGSASSPIVAMDGNGNAIAVWAQSNGTRYSLWANRYTVGSGWGTAELIETDDAGDVAFVSSPASIGFDASGRAVVVWHQSDGTRDNIWSNRYTPGAGWGTAELLETDNAGRARYPSVAVDAAGNALAVWEQSDGTRANAWSSRYTPGVGWGSPQLLETGNEGSGVSEPFIAVDRNGNAMATWNQTDASNRRRIEFARYTAGVGWGAAAVAATNSVGSVSGMRFAFDANGDAVAVWNTTDGTNSIVAFGRYTVAGGWVRAGGAGGSSSQAVIPRIAVDADGNAIAVWLQNTAVAGNSAPFSVWAARYQ